MSREWVTDIYEMHDMYGVHGVIENMDKAKLQKFLEFRLGCVAEELDELNTAISEGNAEETVDALIDICVFAIGTLDAMEVDAYDAWDRVHKANMSKEVGIKAERPNPLGLPDLIKPEGWTAPSHENNHGLIGEIFK
jgi:NTP pyrophosphatase (non-canonical NTP hydrolase)